MYNTDKYGTVYTYTYILVCTDIWYASATSVFENVINFASKCIIFHFSGTIHHDTVGAHVSHNILLVVWLIFSKLVLTCEQQPNRKCGHVRRIIDGAILKSEFRRRHKIISDFTMPNQIAFRHKLLNSH